MSGSKFVIVLSQILKPWPWNLMPTRVPVFDVPKFIMLLLCICMFWQHLSVFGDALGLTKMNAIASFSIFFNVLPYTFQLSHQSKALMPTSEAFSIKLSCICISFIALLLFAISPPFENIPLPTSTRLLL